MNHLTRTITGVLLIAIAIVGCKREQVDVNPNFDPEKDEVNAAFVLSVSTGSSRTTKMSAENVQKNNNFLGITDAKVILYADGATSPNEPFVKSTDGSKWKETYDLGAVLTPGSINVSQNATSSSNRVLQLSIPLGADAALFYGKAVNGSPGKVQGKMDFSHIDNNPDSTYFCVERRIGTEDDVDKYDATARLMIYAINFIIHSEVDALSATPSPYSVNGYTCTGDLQEMRWHDLGHQWEVNNASTGGNPYGRTGVVTTQAELAKSMGQAYALFTHLKFDRNFTDSTDIGPKLIEYRAGSSASVKHMMQGLYSVLEHTSNAVPLNDEEANVIRLANKAIDNMNMFFNSNWTYKDISAIKSSVVPTYKTLDQWNDETTGFSNATNLNNYPYLTFGIPEGAAQLTFNPDGDLFSYTHPNKALVTPGREFEPRKYVYPAELVYYVNSPLLITSKANLSVTDFPNGTGPWNNYEPTGKWKLGSWEVGRVASDTRGVAIRDNINYGVALLETNVAYTADAVSSGLDDNRHAMTGENDNTIDTEEANFQLRGVLVGGVHPRYNWQLIPRALTAKEQAAKESDNTTPKYGVFDGVIYDDAIPSTSIPTSQPNYTLVYDNYDYSKADNVAQNDVYVALEFVNNGDAFWGRDNLIPAGGVFYLGAKLTVAPKELGNSDATQTISWPDDHQIPPINEETGLSKQIPRVFIQDFLTKATFRIGQNSLKYAYYSVPDLATSQMSFGLSVELSWASGYEYDIEFGENPGPANP